MSWRSSSNAETYPDETRCAGVQAKCFESGEHLLCVLLAFERGNQRQVAGAFGFSQVDSLGGHNLCWGGAVFFIIVAESCVILSKATAKRGRLSSVLKSPWSSWRERPALAAALN